MPSQAVETCVVTLKPLSLWHEAGSPLLGRMSIDKRFQGDLDAVSLGEMLMAGTSTKGSAGYVAIEHATGVLHGRRGSFSLQHFGVMDRGNPSLTLTVVPDSGTDELLGLSGSMQIEISSGQHAYTFDYELASTTPAPSVEA